MKTNAIAARLAASSVRITSCNSESGATAPPRGQSGGEASSSAIRAAGKIAGTLVVSDTAAEFVAAGCGFLYEHANNFLAAGAAEFRRRLG
jgi:hypothetical protein